MHPRTRTAARPRGGDTHLEQEIRLMNTEEGDRKEDMGYEVNSTTLLHTTLHCSDALWYCLVLHRQHKKNT